MLRKVLFLAVVICLVGIIGCAPKPGVITVGSKQFTEQVILGQMMRILLEENGFQVNDKIGLGGTMINRKALENNEIDVYMEYTGTALLLHLKHKEPITDPEECYKVVKREDKERNGLIWLKPCKFNNTYTLMMRKKEAKRLNIETISDLAKYVKRHPKEISLATDAEFFTRPDGYPALERRYGFEFPSDKIIKMDPGLTYEALRTKEVEVAMGFATDGRIAAFGFVSLIDDKHFFPVYNPAPVVRKAILDKYPRLEKILNKIGPRLDTARMRELNKRVDVDHEEPAKVAKEFLREKGLI